MHSFLGLLFVFCLLNAAAAVAGVSANRSESVEHLLGLIGFGNGGKFNSLLLANDWQSVALNLSGRGSGLQLFSGGVVDETLLWLVLTSGEDDELALVGVQSGNVQLQLLLGGAGATVINGDTNGACNLCVQAGASEFSESETAAVANLASVLAGGLGNNWTKSFSGSGEDASCLSDSILVSLDLLRGLVEVGFGALLPVFAEVDVDDHVVVLDHC